MKSIKTKQKGDPKREIHREERERQSHTLRGSVLHAMCLE